MKTSPLKFRDMTKKGQPLEKLRRERRWVLWKYEKRGGKQTKVPYSAKTQHRCDITKSCNWSTFFAAREIHKQGAYAGLGFVLGGSIVGIDIDKCCDPTTDDICDHAKGIVESMRTYGEVSPSGTGVKFLGLYHGPAFQGINRRGGPVPIEIYSESRYFTITGHQINEFPIKDITSSVDALIAQIAGGKLDINTDIRRDEPRLEPVPLSDIDVIAKVRSRRDSIWNGELDGYRSQSERDAALFMEIAFYCGDDPERVLDIARKSKCLRPKWNAQRGPSTWAYQQICNAISKKTDFYQGSSKEDILHTEGGNAIRLIGQFGKKIRYCSAMGGWHVYSDGQWKRDHTHLTAAMGKGVVSQIFRDAADATSTDRRDQLLKFGMRSDNARSIEHMLRLARSDQRIAATPDQFDTDPWLFNLENGTVDLRTGKLRAYDPNDLICKKAPVIFKPNSKCPRFLQFIDEIFRGQTDLISFVKRWFGYCMTGDIREQVLPVFQGSGANGKSTLLDLVSMIMGDYACQAPPELLTVSSGREHPTEIATLKGRRLVVASETEEGKRMRVQLVKRLTGDRALQARFMRQDFFEFQRTNKTILVTNNKPRITESTNAIWRRIKLVRFDAAFGPDDYCDHKANPLLLDDLLAEKPGILNWMIRGCMEWQEKGLGSAKQIDDATREYQAAEDLIGNFITDCGKLDAQGFVATNQLYQKYQLWSDDNGYRSPMVRQAFANRLADHPKLKSTKRRIDVRGEKKQVRGWLGIRLT